MPNSLNTKHAIIFLIIGNLFASLSDVTVKLLDGGVSPFQYMFLRQLITVILIWPFWQKMPTQQQKLSAPYLTLFRAHLVLIGSGCMMVSITYLPLATANAIFYAAPLIMLPLSIILLKEYPSLEKVCATSIAFIGVLVVLRPSQYHWAALFALGTAVTLALFNIMARKLPKEQSVISTLFWTSLFSLPASGLLAAFYWQHISLQEWLWIGASSIFILMYNGLAVLAYQRAPAGQIALAEYTGLIFVVILGIWWFDEIPDMLTGIGIALIILPLLPIGRLRKAK